MNKITLVLCTVFCLFVIAAVGCVGNDTSRNENTPPQISEPEEPDNTVRRYTKVIKDMHIELSGNTGGAGYPTSGPFEEGDKITITISNIEGGNRDVYFNYPGHENVYIQKNGQFTFYITSDIASEGSFQPWFKNDDGFYKELDMKIEMTYEDIGERDF